MDQFGIDLDQVLNDFEEQENRKEIENLRDFGGNDEIQTDIFCDGKVLHQSKSQTCESTSEAKISKHCLPSTNNILSSLNKYCKHFLRENVVNHVCCNDSRFHDKSPSEDNASGLDEIVEGFPSSPTNDLESAVTAEVLDDDVECDETKNIDEFDQEFLIESCICVENFKPVLLRNSRHNVSSMPESFAHLNLSQEHLLMNSEVAECVESPKSNEADACAAELPKIDLEIIPIESLPKEIFDKSFGTTFNDPIIVNAEDYSNVQSDAVIAKEGFKKTAVLSESYTEGTSSGESDEFPEGIAKSSLDEAKDHLETEHEKLTRDVDSSSVETSASEQLVVDINHDTCIFSETERIIESETSDHEANSFTLVESFAKGNEGENKEEFSFSQAKVIGKNETAGFEIGALAVEKSMSEQLVEEPIADRTVDEIKAGKIFGDHNDSSKEVECFQESSSSEEPYHAFRVQEEFDEDTFVKLSDADVRCQSSEVESQTHEQFIDVGAFNLSDMVAEDEYKNGESERKVDDNEYEDGDHDEDSIALKKLELEAAAFIEELNVAISNDSRDQITLEDESTAKDVGGSNGEKSLAITDKLQILLHEKEKLLLDELNKHKNCLPLLEQELEQIPLENDAISLEDLKSDGDDQETMDDLQKGDSFSEAKILTSKIVEAFASANDLLVQDGDDLCNGISNVAAAEARVQDSIAHHSNNVIKSDQPMDCTEDGEASEGSSNNLEEQLSRDGCINLPGETSQNVPSDSIAEIHRSSAIGQPEKKTHSNSSYPHSRPTHPGSLQFTQPQFFHAPSRCSNIDLPITDLGKVSPPWLPDSSTSKCLQCETSFSFLRRRHHCRACGLIFCNECCNVRYPLEYLNKKEERVCCKCFVDFNRASSYQNMLSSMSIPTRTSRPNPNNSSEYCSTIPPPLQAGTPSDPLPPVMVPTGVLRKQGMPRQPSENKQVMFSDGIRPGGDLTHLDERPEGASGGGSKKKKSSKSSGSSSHRRQSPLSVASAPGSSNPAKSVFNQSSTSGWSEGSLPPMAVYSAQDFGYVLDRSKSSEEVFKLATDENNRAPVLFWLNTNLTVLVKVIKKMCCAKRDLWCFTSQGMSTVGQDEVIILMEFNQSESVIPLDIFQAISAVYTSACSGSPIQNMGSIILPMSNRQEICGFLFINQTIQCVQNILLPDSPFLFGVFIKQVELTWARAFPLRLFFRLGAEFRYYPCPLFGVRDRAPVYGEIGHTIMNLLADFRNFQYSLSAVEDMAIHVEEKLTTIFLPRYKHHQVLKALSNSDDHVLALAGNFSFTADSHLVCSQNAEGSYQTQAMNIQGKIRSVTGASFVVFNGALKAASGYKAKMSIIEDGLMVQITPEDMAALKQTLGTADDFTIDCGLSSRTPPSSPGGEGAFEGMVALKWFSERIEKNSDIKSPIDKLNLSQLEHKRIHTSNVYATSEEGFVIIWTGLFFLNPSCASQTLRPEIERFSDLLASSCCKCLTPYIAFLFPPLLSKLTLRVKVSPDQIGYEAGINGSQLSNECLVALDNVVIPLLHGSSFASQPHDTSLELLFVVAKPIKA